MAYKIALNAGHGLNTAGKRCLASLDPNETREWYLNSRICNKIEDKLEAYDGYELIRLDDTTGKTDVALKTRTDKANSWGADFYLAIHHNAGVKGGKGGGIIAIVYTSVDNTTLSWQKALYYKLVEHTGLKGNRANPLQKQNLHEVRESKMPAVLLECGFMDSATDVPIILTEDYADKVATACVEVLVDRGGLIKKVVETKPSETVVSKSVDEIAKEVLRGLWGNGSARKDNLEKAGYDYATVQAKVNELVKGTTATASVKYFTKYNGESGSIVSALNTIGVDSSFTYRKKIAKANGITLYVGTASQNIKLLTLLKQGKLVKP